MRKIKTIQRIDNTEHHIGMQSKNMDKEIKTYARIILALLFYSCNLSPKTNEQFTPQGFKKPVVQSLKFSHKKKIDWDKIPTVNISGCARIQLSKATLPKLWYHRYEAFLPQDYRKQN